MGYKSAYPQRWQQRNVQVRVIHGATDSTILNVNGCRLWESHAEWMDHYEVIPRPIMQRH